MHRGGSLGKHLDRSTCLRARQRVQPWRRAVLTVGVHMVTGHLWWREALLEGVRVVATVLHGHQLLLLVGS